MYHKFPLALFSLGCLGGRKYRTWVEMDMVDLSSCAPQIQSLNRKKCLDLRNPMKI